MPPASTSSTAEVSPLVAPDPPPRPVFIGIDWADQAHAMCLIDPTRPTPQHSALAHKPEAIVAWAEALHKKYAGRELCLIIESSKGALITALVEVGGFTIYPINPKQAARYREALHPTGSQSDPADAHLLATFLMHHRDALRALQTDTPETRRLAELTRLRREQVEERKRITLQLRSLLQKYFPLLLDLFKDQLDEPLVIDLLKRWPSLLVLKRVNPSLLNTFLKEHGIRREDRREELVKQIQAAVDLTRDKALIEPLASVFDVSVPLNAPNAWPGSLKSSFAPSPSSTPSSNKPSPLTKTHPFSSPSPEPVLPSSPDSSSPSAPTAIATSPQLNSKTCRESPP